MNVLRVAFVYQAIALFTLLVWPIFMFSYLHDRMHIEKFWMTRVPVLKTWFLGARRMHDIHHRSIDNQGFMDTNFGIGFYLFDRIFGTAAHRHRRINWTGYRCAVERYGLDQAGLLSLRDCSKALFDKTHNERAMRDS